MKHMASCSACVREYEGRDWRALGCADTKYGGDTSPQFHVQCPAAAAVALVTDVGCQVGARGPLRAHVEAGGGGPAHRHRGRLALDGKRRLRLVDPRAHHLLHLGDRHALEAVVAARSPARGLWFQLNSSMAAKME